MFNVNQSNTKDPRGPVHVLNILWIGTCYDTEHGFALGNWADWWHHQPSMPRSAKPSICPLFSLLVSSSCHCSLLGFVCLLFSPTLVFCCIVPWMTILVFSHQSVPSSHFLPLQSSRVCLSSFSSSIDILLHKLESFTTSQTDCHLLCWKVCQWISVRGHFYITCFETFLNHPPTYIRTFSLHKVTTHPPQCPYVI